MANPSDIIRTGRVVGKSTSVTAASIAAQAAMDKPIIADLNENAPVKKKPLHPTTGYYMRMMTMAARRGRLKRKQLTADPVQARSTTVELPDDINIDDVLPQQGGM